MARTLGSVLFAGFVLGGLIFGALDAALNKTADRGAADILYGAMLSGFVSGSLGLLLTLASYLAQRSSRVGRAVELLSSGAYQPALHKLYSVAAAMLLVASVASDLAAPAFDLLAGLQERELAHDLMVAALAAGIVAAVVATIVVAAGLRYLGALFARRVSRFSSLPAPIAWFVLVVVPAWVTLYGLVREHRTILGVGSEVAVAGILVAVGLNLTLWLNRLDASRRRFVAIAAGAVWLLVTAFGAFASADSIRGGTVSSSGSLGLRLAVRLTDFDRDGASSLFGGQDCAPFDRARGVGLRDVPGNGIDEDCSGSDASAVLTIAPKPQFSSALTTPQVENYNIVWIVLETVRADRVSAFGYDKPTTPFLESLAKESLAFERAYSQSSATAFSIPSMLSGVDPSSASWYRKLRNPQLDPSHKMLAERLQARGYKTGFVYDRYLDNSFESLRRGIDLLYVAEPPAGTLEERLRRNPWATARAAEFLAHVPPTNPFMLVAYFPDAHSPYTRHVDIDSTPFAKGESGDYEVELVFVDQQVRALVELLRSRPTIWDHTIVVVSADHGEEFGEHGGDRHARTCHEEVAHVPLLVRIPNFAPQRIEARVALVDIVPTLLELLGLSSEAEGLSGQSLLVPALTPQAVDPSRPIFCSVASTVDSFGVFLRRAVRTDRFALLQDVSTGRFSLFDAINDRAERNDIVGAAEYAEAREALKRVLDESLTGNITDHTKMSPPRL